MSTRHMERKQQTWAILRMRGMMEGRCVCMEWDRMNGWIDGKRDSGVMRACFFLAISQQRDQTSKSRKKNENPPVGSLGERGREKEGGGGRAGLFEQKRSSVVEGK